jgi:BT1 family protein
VGALPSSGRVRLDLRPLIEVVPLVPARLGSAGGAAQQERTNRDSPIEFSVGRGARTMNFQALASAERRYTKLADDQRHTTTANSRSSRRLYFLCIALLRAERRRSDRRAHRATCAVSAQNLGESPAAIGALMALLALPWTIKPIFGLLSDFVPLFGSRRRNYLLLANGAATVFATVMALTNFAGSGSEAFGGWLFEATKASFGRETAFSLVVAVSVAAAVSCWLLVPLLRRAAPRWWD